MICFNFGEQLAGSYFSTGASFINSSITFSRDPYILLPSVGAVRGSGELSEIPGWWGKTDMFLNPVRMQMWQTGNVFWDNAVGIGAGIGEAAMWVVPTPGLGLLGKAATRLTNAWLKAGKISAVASSRTTAGVYHLGVADKLTGNLAGLRFIKNPKLYFEKGRLVGLKSLNNARRWRFAKPKSSPQAVTGWQSNFELKTLNSLPGSNTYRINNHLNIIP